MSPIGIVRSLIKFSLYIGLTGGLVDMTRAVMLKAADAHQTGLAIVDKFQERRIKNHKYRLVIYKIYIVNTSVTCRNRLERS